METKIMEQTYKQIGNILVNIIPEDKIKKGSLKHYIY